MTSMKHPSPLSRWKAILVADLARVADRQRWGLAFMLMGWVHLATFVTCQVLYTLGDRRNIDYLALWALELVGNLFVMRRVAGADWYRSTPLAGVLCRVWATFLILSFNVASLNNFTGFSIEWFKPVWASLSTFGFAVTAYLVSTLYFIPAVQMYFTGLGMLFLPQWAYLIYAISWWASFQGIGWTLEKRRARQEPTAFQPALREFNPSDESLLANSR